MNEVVSTVVRFHDPAGLARLERAIQSLHSQTDVLVQTIVVTQGFNGDDLARVRECVGRQWFFEWMPRPVVLNHADQSRRDIRSDLINLGIEEHKRRGNRYLAFLDYDDLLYTHAYKTLTAALSNTAAAVAFAGMEMAHAVGLQDYDFIYEMSKPFKGKNKLDLVHENFAPLHSYMVDCSKVSAHELQFRSELNRVEDYDFLLRVAGPNPCDFSQLKVCIGAYIQRSDDSNTTPKGVDTPEDKIKQEVWKSNRDLLNSLRSTYEVKLFASDL
jgi:hypothetical protein